MINYWGRAVGCGCSELIGWAALDRVIASLQRRLGAGALARRMHFPTRWDPFFTDSMTLLDVYHYATQHFDFHRAQLTLGEDS